MRSVRTLIGALVAALVIASCGSGTVSDARKATVASVGAEVMPFDQQKTTHTFTKTADGGHQEVTANDASDSEQISLVRQHLTHEQASFSSGNYADPARIHGMDMPGVSELAAGHQRINVTYRELPSGAALDYRTDDAALVNAIHEWFDRQLMDHGDHARAG